MFFKKIFNNRVAKNASWIIISKIIQAILGLVVNMLTARFLGPMNYGIINYASSIVAFVIPVMNLGLSNILVQELLNNPEEEGKILGTSVLLSLISSTFCIGGILTYTFIVDVGEQLTNLVVGLYSIMLLVLAFELIQYWYQAKLLSKYMAIVSLVAFTVATAYKVVLLILKLGVPLFALSNSIDYLIIVFALFIIYKKKDGQNLAFSWPTAKRMLGKSKHYIISSMMVTIFAQTDKIMIKLIIDETAVGYYSAAVNCAGMTSFVFVAIIDSFRPIIYEHKKNGDEKNYEKNIERLYFVVIYLALLQSIAMTILAYYLIMILYGSDYLPSILALQIIVWYTTFSYMGAVRNIWILGENKQKYLWILNLGGAVINVVLNLFFIHLWGIYGAAIASLITQFFTNVIMNIIVWPLRHNNTLIIKGLNPSLLLDLFK